MLNRVVLIGRLTRDPELRYTNNGTPTASFTLAVDRAYKNEAGERETDFIDVVVWRQMAEHCANYLAKGKLAAVDGKIQIRAYTVKDGSKRKSVEVVADTVRFLSPVNILSPVNKISTEEKNYTAEEEKPWPVSNDDKDGDLPF